MTGATGRGTPRPVLFDAPRRTGLRVRRSVAAEPAHGAEAITLTARAQRDKTRRRLGQEFSSVSRPGVRFSHGNAPHAITTSPPPLPVHLQFCRAAREPAV